MIKVELLMVDHDAFRCPACGPHREAFCIGESFKCTACGSRDVVFTSRDGERKLWRGKVEITEAEWREGIHDT